MVEFALAITVFIALFAGLLDGAWYVFARSSVTSAAREAARKAIVASTFCDQTAAANAARSNSGPFSGAINVTATSGSDTAGSWCQVTVSYPYAPLGGQFLLPPTTIQSSAREYQN